jgi:asparagine N-glycosylation enzyme membrane subunit Stt3
MNGWNFMQGWLTLVGSFAIIALVLTAFGLMLGILKLADAFKRIGVIVGTVIALLILPQIVIGEWMALTIWHQIGIVVLVVSAFLLFGWLRSRIGKGPARRGY